MKTVGGDITVRRNIAQRANPRKWEHRSKAADIILRCLEKAEHTHKRRLRRDNFYSLMCYFSEPYIRCEEILKKYRNKKGEEQ